MAAPIRLSLLLALVVLAPAGAWALDKDNPFDAELKTTSLELAPGGKGAVSVGYRVFSKDFFIYRDMSDVVVVDAGGLTVGAAAFPKGEVKLDKISGENREIFHQDFVVTVPVEVPAGFSGSKTITLQAKWQGCNGPENFCLFPSTKDLSVQVRAPGSTGASADGSGGAVVADEAGAGGPPAGEGSASIDAPGAEGGAAVNTPERPRPGLRGDAGPGPGSPASEACAGTAAGGSFVDNAIKAATAMVTAAAGGSFLTFLLVIFVAGLASSLTPCVYPMIPITISVIGASADQGRAVALARTVVYVAGICVTYTALGVFAALSGGMFGAMLQSPVVVVGISLLFFALALAMYGLYEFALPESLTTRASMAGGGGGWTSAFVVGAVAGVVAAPCTGPVVSFLLVKISTTPGWGLAHSVAIMLAYSLGLGTLFFFVGAFAGALGSLPRSGAWMVTVKHVFGHLITAGAIYFLGTAKVLPDAAITALWAALLVFASFDVAGGMELLRGPRKPLRMAAGAALLIAFSPTLLEQLAGHEGPAMTWVREHDAGLIAGRTASRPVILDFTADWCQACKELEHLTYTDPAVVQCAGEFQPVMVDGTKDTPEFQNLRDHYGFKGLPAVYFICPEGKLLSDLTLTGFEPADEFLAKMNRALHACRQDGA